MKREHFYYLITLFGILIFLVPVFIHRYGPSFNKLPFFDDYLETYCMSIKGIEMLFEGGLFGWDSNHLGGYPIVYTGPTMLTFLLLPFYLLAKSYAFQLMLLCLWLAFPVCIGVFTHTLFNNWKITVAALILATGALLFYLRLCLRWGDIHAFAGVVVFVVCFIFYERLRHGRAWAYLGCVFFTTLLYYTYYPYAIFFMGFIFIHWLTKPTKGGLLAILLIGVALFLTTLPYNWYYIAYHKYAMHSFTDYHANIAYRPLNEIGPFVLSKLKECCYLEWKWQRDFFVFIAPFYVSGLFIKRLRPYSVILFFMVLICFLSDVWIETDWISRILPQRILFLMPVFAVPHFAYILANISPPHIRTALGFLIILTFLFFKNPYRFKVDLSISTMRDYNGPLFENIRKLDGHLILFENITSDNLLFDKEDSRFRRVGHNHTHMASLMAMDTGKKFFSSTHEGWHETVFRGNCINTGVFRGQYISDVEIDEIEAVLQKWGIVYLVVWHKYSKRYFSSFIFEDKFELYWDDNQWSIFKYRNADGRSVQMATGQGWITRETYFSKKIRIHNASQGDIVVVRSNYFPTWKAFYNGIHIPTLDIDGQLGFIAPANGSYTITLRFPKYLAFNILSVLTLFGVGVLAGNRKFQSLLAS